MGANTAGLRSRSYQVSLISLIDAICRGRGGVMKYGLLRLLTAVHSSAIKWVPVRQEISDPGHLRLH